MHTARLRLLHEAMVFSDEFKILKKENETSSLSAKRSHLAANVVANAVDLSGLTCKIIKGRLPLRTIQKGLKRPACRFHLKSLNSMALAEYH